MAVPVGQELWFFSGKGVTMKGFKNPPFFIKIIDGKLILWDYKHHTQFEISSGHLDRILAISQGSLITEQAIDLDIQQSGIFDGVAEDHTEWGWDCLSELYHMGTQLILEEGTELPVEDRCEEYAKYCTAILETAPTMHSSRSGERVALPNPTPAFPEHISFWQLLKQRKTSRSFTAEPLPIETLSEILYWTFGAVHGATRHDVKEAGLIPFGYRRTSPSGGSLQASEAYLVALQIAGLPNGIYHYDPIHHCLRLINEPIDGKLLGGLLGGQMCASALGMGIFVTSRFNKLWWKYPHSRAYRVALIDVGCLTQTFQLVTTAFGLDSWPTGYFFDQEVNQLLQIDGVNEAVLFFLGAGNGTGSPFYPPVPELLERLQPLVT